MSVPVQPIDEGAEVAEKQRWHRWRTALAFSTRVARRALSASKVFENVAVVSIVAVCLGGIAVVAALLLRTFEPEPQLIVSDLVMATGDAKTGDAIGMIAANLLSDSLDSVIADGAAYNGNAYASSYQFLKSRDLPKIPVSRAFDFTVKGVSLSQVADGWDFVRHQQEHISGEVLPAMMTQGGASAGICGVGSGGGNVPPGVALWVIHARLTDERTLTWTSKPFAMSHDCLRGAARDIAEQIMVSKDPELAGRYFLSHQDAKSASFAFSQWLSTNYNDPVPNVWLAKTYSRDGNPEDLLAAKMFAARARNLSVKPAWWRFEKRREAEWCRQSALLVLAYVARHTGDYAGAKAALQEIPENPAAWLNLGELEQALGKNDQEAKRDAQTAINKESEIDGGVYTGAYVNQAKIDYDMSDYAAADRSVDVALDQDPLFPDAMEFKVTNDLIAKNYEEGRLYCAEWVTPMVEGLIRAVPSPATLFGCVRQEALGASPDVVRIEGYVTALEKAAGRDAPLTKMAVQSATLALCPVADLSQGTRAQANGWNERRDALREWLNKRGWNEDAKACEVKAGVAAETRKSSAPVGGPAVVPKQAGKVAAKG